MNTVIALFEQQVKCTPDKIAVWHNGEALSYQQLNQRANQLAHYLQFIGIYAEQLVGICLPRSVDLLVGVLGILKAGAAYVPFDPSYPEQRLAYMLADSQLKCLLFTEETRRLTPDTHYHRIDLKQDAAYIRQQPTDNLLLPISASHLAYCLYTSGSTGLPKAVLMEHRSLANLITWHLRHRLTPARQLQFSPISFDISAQEIFATWCSGGCLFSIAENLRRDPMALLDFINTHQIEKLYLPFTPLQQLAFVAHDAGKYPVSVREVITAGEQLQITSEIKAFFLQTQATLHNHYGMTECQDVTALTLTGSPESWSLLPSIGKAIDNLQTYILNEAGQAVAEGETGELFIGGYGLARGYLGRPDLSAEKFIEVDLFGKRERIYKTGDLARQLPDGNIDCLGRIDHQVKLRGFRIELGEIEAVLRQHSAIKEAVVNVYEADGNKRLIAYLTLNDEKLVIADLRHWLKTRLLEYMLPSAFMVLDVLPVNANGKIDRKTLPTPELTAAVDFSPPVTPTEELLATLWAGLLKCNAVSREDNFFELGGHSLLATQLVMRIRDAFHVELPLLAIFEHPQLSNLATTIEATFGSICLPAIELQAADVPKVLSYAQQRLWFLNQLENNHSASYNEPYTLRLSGHLSIKALQQSLRWLVERHTSLRSYFPTHEGQAQVQLHAIESIEVLRTHDLRQLVADVQQQEVHNLANHHAVAPFDLEHGTLFKADLLLLDENQSVLLLNMHHIITDGWSIGVFMRDWQQAYRAFAQGGQPSLPPLKIQYSDYAAWQRQWLQGEILQRQVDYWTKQLAGIPELLELPTDKPRPPRQSYQGARYANTLSSELSQSLTQLSRARNATVFMTLLAAFNILLSRYSRQEDIFLGSAIANRTHSHTDDLIGFFVNTLVLRSQVDPQQSFVQLLQTTRQTCLEAYTHQDIPFETLVEQLQPSRSLSHSPLFQVMFVLQNNQVIELALPELDITVLETNCQIAKFDLTLNIEECNGQLHCIWEYATDLFLPETIERMAQHFEVLLTAIVENPEQAICQLSMLTIREIGQLQVFNNTQTDYSHYKTVLDLFEQQVEKTPDNLALVFKNQALTYRQLNKKANQLAHFLLNLKTAAGSFLLVDNPLIAIAVERSLEMIIALWAILKTGAAYVPVDPDYPAERICYLLKDSRARLLLTQNRLQSVLTECSPHCLVLNLDEIDVIPYANENPRLTVHPENLAYVIYTSGSTGQPKGVLIEHRQLLSSTLARLDYYPNDSQPRLLSLPSFAFDAFGAGFYLALLTGGSLHLPQNSGDVEQLASVINAEKITHLVGTPMLYQELLRQTPSPLSSLRCIIIGGEAASSTLLQEHFSKMPQAGLFNEYGPTEATIWSTVFPYQAAGQATNIIGKPIANTRIYILNKQLQPQPLNIPGELCIAGDGLARGYLNQPELTAEKFLEVELFGQRERIYKTGDLARWLSDGNLEYLGRIDHQVKLRGFRIELGEIEAALSQHSVVKEAVVNVYEADGNKRLVAYIVPRSSRTTLDNDEQYKQVEHWEKVFEGIYLYIDNEESEDKFNTAGWNSSYTGLPIPKAEMQEWLDGTVERVQATMPGKVLEIGSGSGMILFRLAPFCSHYTAIDISQQALDYIEQQKKNQEWGSRVALYQGAAHNLDGFEATSVDTVIINSVIQYFPSIDYLIAVLTKAVTLVAPGGFLFIGDVRNFQLLEAFHASVQFHRADKSLSLMELQRRIKTAMSREEELLVSPDFFIALKHHLPQITQVQIQLKQGYAHNEMTRFRYDVTLHIGGELAPLNKIQWLDWQAEQLTLVKVRQFLLENQTDIIGLRNIPNARLLAEKIIVERLSHLEEDSECLQIDIGNLAHGVEPEEFRVLARDLPYTTYINYDGKYHFSVVFQRKISQSTLPRFEELGYVSKKPWHNYANSSSQRPFTAYQLASELRDFINQTLPDYMIPSVFMPLEAMPLTPNGKIDRKALPSPEASLMNGYEAPRNATEQQLAEIWSSLFNRQTIGIHDNFFGLGGNSILSIQMVARCQQAGLQFTPRDLFERQTIAELAGVLSKMQAVEIAPVPRTDNANLPLSFGQYRMWLKQTAQPDQATFNFSDCFHLTGKLDKTALQHSLNEIIRRHEILHTVFPVQNGNPVQFILPVVPTSIICKNFSDLPENSQMNTAENWAREQMRCHFDLVNGPLLHIYLVQLARESHLLLLNAHHLITDMMSQGIFMDELLSLYSATVAGKPSPLPDLPIQFADYALWQRQTLTGEALEKRLNYWRTWLAKGEPPVLSLPTDRVRVTPNLLEAGIEMYQLPAELVKELKSLSRRSGVTLYSIFLTALSALLSSYSDCDDIVIASPIANRNHSALEPLIGLIGSMLLLRIDLSDKPNFSVLLTEVQQRVLAAIAHQDQPFEESIKILQPERQRNTPVARVVLNFLPESPNKQFHLPELTLSPLLLDEVSMNLDLVLAFWEEDGGLSGWWRYRKDIFDASTLVQIHQNFLTVLKTMLTAPQQSIAQLSLHSKE